MFVILNDFEVRTVGVLAERLRPNGYIFRWNPMCFDMRLYIVFNGQDFTTLRRLTLKHRFDLQTDDAGNWRSRKYGVCHLIYIISGEKMLYIFQSNTLQAAGLLLARMSCNILW